MYYIWKHSKMRIVVKGFWTMFSSQICHAPAHTRAKMGTHTLSDTDKYESVLQTPKNIKAKI